MTWSYTWHRFATQEEYEAACEGLVPSDSVLDVIGTIWTGGTPDPITGFPVGQTPLPGYHVNAAWQNGMPESFRASLLDPPPNNPVRVWA